MHDKKYECPECGNEFIQYASGPVYCDWFDCENEEPLDPVDESWMIYDV